MEETYRDLASTVRAQANQATQGRLLVAIAGPPGSGKTSITEKVVALLNEAEQTTAADKVTDTIPSTRAVAISMDGFHLSRATLDKQPNRAEAYMRRGAPWTFDAEGVLEFTRGLRHWADRNASESHPELPLYAPSFDHALKDPKPCGITIFPATVIVFLEGNYLLLDEPIWREIAPLVDLRIFIDVDEETARTRVAKRHVAAGIERNLEDAYKRVDGNDTLNGQIVRDRLLHDVDIFIQSTHDVHIGYVGNVLGGNGLGLEGM